LGWVPVLAKSGNENAKAKFQKHKMTKQQRIEQKHPPSGKKAGVEQPV